jgi:hypothetical protein
MLTHLETWAFPMMKWGRRNHRNFGSWGMWSGELPRFPTTGASFSGGKLHFERI